MKVVAVRIPELFFVVVAVFLTNYLLFTEWGILQRHRTDKSTISKYAVAQMSFKLRCSSCHLQSKASLYLGIQNADFLYILCVGL